MSKPLFVLISDSHLDPVTYQDMEELRRDSEFGFRQGLELARKLKLPVLSAGDTVECNPRDYPKPEIIKVLSSEFDKMQKLDLSFMYINGNHDKAVDGVSLPEAVNPNVAKNINGMLIALPNNQTLVGMNYVFHHELENALSHVRELSNKGTLLMCHQRWKQFLNFDNSFDGTLTDIPNKFRQVISGDLHSAKLINVRTKKRDNPLQVLSPGATCKRASSEPDKHYAWIVGHDGKKFTFKKRLLKSRPVTYFQIDTLDDIDSLMDSYKAIFNRIKSSTEDHPAEIRKPLAFITGKIASENFEAIREVISPFFFVRKRGRDSRERSGERHEVERIEDYDNATISVLHFVKDVAKSEASAKLVAQGLRADDKVAFMDTWEKSLGL